MMIYPYAVAALFALMIVACVLYRYYRAKAAKAEQALVKEQQQTAVLKTQLKNQREREKHEQNISLDDRDQLLERLSAASDLRDE